MGSFFSCLMLLTESPHFPESSGASGARAPNECSHTVDISSNVETMHERRAGRCDWLLSSHSKRHVYGQSSVLRSRHADTILRSPCSRASHRMYKKMANGPPVHGKTAGHAFDAQRHLFHKVFQILRSGETVEGRMCDG